jgi:hypothetical protein
MRFRKGIGSPYPRRPRGRGHGQYHISRAAYQARIRNLAAWDRPRTYDQTRRIEIEVALASHRREPYRAMAKRLGLRSYAHCWRVARRYRAGGLPMLPLTEPELVAFRDSLYANPVPATPLLGKPAARNDPNSLAHAQGCPCRNCAAKAEVDAALARARKKQAGEL